MLKIPNKPDLPIWSYFSDILTIPRPSGKEEKILEYLKKFAAKHNLDCTQDKPGNLLIKKNATKGKEGLKTIILQAHVDMVCEKNADTVHDFDKDPIITLIEEGWIKTSGTTLGADDGIGVAAMLAVLSATDIEHGPLECLFTVNEETGMTGALGLDKNLLNGKILLNLDSEDEGELFIGCAGGIDTTVRYKINYIKTPASHKAYTLFVNGLKGGHSGDEIHKGLGNSIKILNRILWKANYDFDLKLSKIEGGNLRNAIAREAFAEFIIPEDKIFAFNEFLNTEISILKKEYSQRDPGLKIILKELAAPTQVFDKSFQEGLLSSLYACPHGALSMSHNIPGLVETSTNLASIKHIDNNNILITTSQRSSLESAKKDVSQMVESVFLLSGADVSHSGSYPGWSPNTDSEILGITAGAYNKLFGSRPKVKAIHAGLECGLFLEKYPDLDMISFGPTIKGAHSPGEKLHIESSFKFWDLLLEVLKNIPEEN